MEKTIGTFKIIRDIGRSEVGVVYKAQDPATQQYVAIKVLPPHIVNPSNVERFQGEVRAMAALRHPNLLAVRDLISEGDQNYLITEYFEGESLRAAIRRRGGLPPEETLRVAFQIADALKCIHAERMVHGDVKPASILISMENHVKLSDFALAKMVSAHLAVDGAVSPEYLSPEQLAGEAVDFRTDIYSFAVTMYEMLLGRPPFTGETVQEVKRRHREEKPPALRDVDPRIPRDVESVVMKAMAFRPDQRYQRTQDLWKELRKLSPGMSSPAKQPPAPTPVEKNPVKPASGLVRPAAKKKIPILPMAGTAVLAGAIAAYIYSEPIETWISESLPQQGGTDVAVVETPMVLEEWARADRHHLAGLTHYNDGDVDGAIAEYLQAIGIRNNEALYYKDLALAYERKNDRENAIAAWKDLLKYERRGMYADLARQHLQTLNKEKSGP